jgi:hypothetical protein
MRPIYLAIFPLLFIATKVQAAAEIYAPTLALYHQDSTDNQNNDVLVSISGVGFGNGNEGGDFQKTSCGLAQGGSFILIRQNNAVQLTIPSTMPSSHLYYWHDTQIVIKVGTGLANKDNLNIQVCTQNSGATAQATVVKYSYAHNQIPTDGGGVPLALARKSDGSLWINEEVHRNLKGRNASGVFSPPTCKFQRIVRGSSRQSILPIHHSRH